MKIRMIIAGALVVVATISPMEMEKIQRSISETVRAVEEEASLSDQHIDEPDEGVDVSHALLERTLSPLKEEAFDIHQKIKTFNALLQQEIWNETILNTVLEEYQKIDEKVDVFPLQYQPILNKVRLEYRLDRSADQLMSEYSTLFTKVTFGLSQYRGMMFDVKKAYSAFKDARLSIKNSSIPLCLFVVRDLEKYKKWSSEEYQGLQKYLNWTATFLLKEIKERKLCEDPNEEIKQEKQKLEEWRIGFEQQRQELSHNVSPVENLLEKPSFEQVDMHQLSERYEGLLGVKKRLQLLKEAALRSSVFDHEIEAQKRLLHKKVEKLHQECSRVIDRCDRVKVKDLKEIFTTFECAEKALQQRVERKKVEQRLFLGNWRPRWLLPQFPNCHVEKVSELVMWDSESQPLQDAVRAQAKKYLQQIGQIVNHPAAQHMTLVAEEFYGYEQRMAAPSFSKDLSLIHDLKAFKQKLIRSSHVVEPCKSNLIKRIEEYIRSCS